MSPKPALGSLAWPPHGAALFVLLSNGMASALPRQPLIPMVPLELLTWSKHKRRLSPFPCDLTVFHPCGHAHGADHVPSLYWKAKKQKHGKLKYQTAAKQDSENGMAI